MVIPSRVWKLANRAHWLTRLHVVFAVQAVAVVAAVAAEAVVGTFCVHYAGGSALRSL